VRAKDRQVSGYSLPALHVLKAATSSKIHPTITPTLLDLYSIVETAIIQDGVARAIYAMGDHIQNSMVLPGFENHMDLAAKFYRIATQLCKANV
jgi:hypothetical protein